MTGIGRFGVAPLVIALTGSAAAQEAMQKLPAEMAALRVNQIATICGEALDLACNGPEPDANLTFITPSASPWVTIGVAPGAQIALDAQSSVRAQHVCATGKVAATQSGYQLQITSRDQIVLSTQSPPVAELRDRPRRGCERGVILPKVRRNVKATQTPDSMRRKVSGRVVLQGVVDTSGRVRDVQVIRTLDPGGLDVTAADAFAQWQFDPGQADGKPVAMIITVDMVFTIMNPE